VVGVICPLMRQSFTVFIQSKAKLREISRKMNGSAKHFFFEKKKTFKLILTAEGLTKKIKI
jgi:hypothetical protein